MIFAFRARLCAQALTVLSIALLTTALTGCSFEAHDTIDTRPPSSMPVPDSVRAAEKKAVEKPVRPAPALPTEAELGIPVYPNATTYVDSTGSPIPTIATEEMATATLSTLDSVDRVVAFYKDRLVETDGSGATLPSTPREEMQNGRRTTIITGNDFKGNILMAIVHDDNGKTVIELMHTHTRSMPPGVSGMPKPGELPMSSLPSSGVPPNKPFPSGRSLDVPTPAGRPRDNLPSSGEPPAKGGAIRN